jgi:hypothetical protein
MSAPQDLQMQAVSPVAVITGAASPQSTNNPIMALVGQNFALVPNVYPYTEGCGEPNLPHKIHVVPVAGEINSPLAVRQVVAQVKQTENNSASTPFRSHISQTMCLCLQTGVQSLNGDQVFYDQGGNATFRTEYRTKCTPFHGGWRTCCRVPNRYSFNEATKEEIGSLEYDGRDCVDNLKICCCLIFWRSASTKEYVWFRAMGQYHCSCVFVCARCRMLMFLLFLLFSPCPDKNFTEQLTFRHPAQEGRCLCCDMCVSRTESYYCCSTMVDLPFHERLTVYGPMAQGNAQIATLDSRGSYGMDTCCGCFHTYGVRPEMAAQLRFMEPVSFERTVLAMQMALHQLESKMTVVGYDGRHHTLPFLKPSTEHMQ